MKLITFYMFSLFRSVPLFWVHLYFTSKCALIKLVIKKCYGELRTAYGEGSLSNKCFCSFAENKSINWRQNLSKRDMKLIGLMPSQFLVCFM